MQKDIQEMHAKLEQTNVLYEQNNLIKEENAKMVNGIHEKYRTKMADKKAKNIERMKELETKFTKL